MTGGELGAVLDAWRRSDDAGVEAVLATVVHVRGSAYRRPGARMLILPDGARVGSVSGGCLEADLVRKAWWSTAGARPVVRVFDTSSEDDAVWEFGLGCNGVVHVLLERTGTEEARALRAFVDGCRASGAGGVLATVVATADARRYRLGRRLLVRGDGVCDGDLVDTPLSEVVARQARAALAQRTSRLLHLDACDVALEWIAPLVRFFVLGAGHDAPPVVALALRLGWRATVADARPAYARPDRFPGAESVLLPRDAGVASLGIGRESMVVLMTHSFPEDARLLPDLLALEPRYLGLLGSADRARRLLAEVGADAASRPWLHAPVGLDIGAEGAEAIALAIVAEAQAALAGRCGGALRLRREPMHEPVEEVGAHQRLAWPPVEAPVCGIAAGDG